MEMMERRCRGARLRRRGRSEVLQSGEVSYLMFFGLSPWLQDSPAINLDFLQATLAAGLDCRDSSDCDKLPLD